MIFYLAEAFRSPFGNTETKEAETKSNFSSLRPAYGINIVDFHLFDQKEPALQTFHLLNEETYRPFVNRNEKELLTLCFLSLKNENIDKQTAVYHWHYFLKTGEVTENAPDYIKEAKRKTDFLTLESEEKEMIMKIDKARAIREAELEEAQEKGIEKGLQKGIEQEKRRLAVKLFKMGFTVEQVSEATGLDIELVRMLKEK